MSKPLNDKKRYYYQLEGLRAFLILLVLASHTSAFKMQGQGGLSVAVFFDLSGFLFTGPGTENGEEKFLSIKYFLSYYWNRALRLYVPFAVVILLYAILTSDYSTLVGNLTLTSCSGHFWFLQQEIVLCALSPFIVLFLS